MASKAFQGKPLPDPEFVEGESTLADMLQVVDRGIYFIRFNVIYGRGLLSSVTIPFCRFRDFTDDSKIYDVRSCDCEGQVCGHPTQRIYISKHLLSQWTFSFKEGIVYVFEYRISDFEPGYRTTKPLVPEAVLYGPYGIEH